MVERRSLAGGTPMIAHRCPDCGFSDQGYVRTDPSTWLAGERE